MKSKYIIISILSVALIGVLIYIKNSSSSISKEIKLAQVDGKYNYGKRIYAKYCVGCHDSKMIEYATAPPLGGITKLRDKKWLYNYTRGSSKMYTENDEIAIKLRSENSGLMPSFPMLNDDKLDAVYYYIEKEFEKNKIEKKN